MPLSSAAAGAWSIVTSSDQLGQTQHFLNGVTCASATDCWAVGRYNAGSAVQTLIERWDGTSWAIVSSPNTSTTQHNILNGVTCVSASDCWAVGSIGGFSLGPFQTLIERWDGTSWTIVSSPSTDATQDNVFSGVTCVSATDCWAVGYSFNDGIYQTLIERWDGTSWAIVTSPNTSGTRNNFLNGVTCTSASECWAVGYDNAGQALIERWDGTSWTIVTSPDTSGYLYGVTCVSASTCWAVGYYYDGDNNAVQTLIERWDGTSWAIVTSPNTLPTRANYLTSVTCASAAECWAVGRYFTGSAYQTLIERWDGTSWAIVTSPNTSGTQDNPLTGVTCASASECWAVGYYDTSYSQTLIERWDGASWAIVASPNTITPQHNVFSDVTCASATECWAVGYYEPGRGVYRTLIERWDGTSWAIVASPNASATKDNILFDVTCASATDCWAVGYYDTGGGFGLTLIERWDGTSWAIVTSPNILPPADQPLLTVTNVLSGVTCASASQCWAVGYSDDGSARQTLIERWDGNSWAIVTSPNIPPPNPFLTVKNLLSGVTCASASDCWAVGSYYNGITYQTLIERWNGASWAVVISPPPVAVDSFLNGVTCVSATNCWAVGYYTTVIGVGQTLIERWDGTAWGIVGSPNTDTAQNNFLSGVTCISASDCWAVGDYETISTFPIPHTLIERWDGTAWTIVTSPNTSATQLNILYGVTCVSASECWAVGSYYNGSKYQTLTERYL